MTATPSPAPLGGRLVTPFTAVLAGFVVVMIGVLAVRFAHGLGAVTNLNNGYPWGIWIIYDVVIGTALGASGFMVAFLTYIVNRGAYHPLVRPALLTALFGYVMAGASVVFDVGRYWNAYHLFMPRYMQRNSVLFEVALCISAYTIVLIVEFLPAVLERIGLAGARRKLERLLFVFVALGVLLPTMHQSSLGSLLIVFGPQIDPIYQTRLLPVLFLSSTVGMGLAAVVLEASVSSLALRRPIEYPLLARLMTIGRVVTAVFLVVRFADLAVRGALPRVFEPRLVGGMFWIEIALFALPLALGFGEAGRGPRRVFVSAMAMAFAGALYRIDAYYVAYATGPGWHYFPSLGELAVTIGLIAFEVLLFLVAVRLLPVLPRAQVREPGDQPWASASSSTR